MATRIAKSDITDELIKPAITDTTLIGAPKVKTAILAGASTGTFYNTTLAGTLAVGDMFTIAGDTTNYTITKSATAAANEIAVEFSPVLAIAADIDDIVTINNPVLVACDLYLTSLAAKYGKTLADIPAALPYDVKELAKIWIGREICRNKSFAQGEAWRGQESGDAWTQKLKHYNNEFIVYEAKMTEKTLFGESQTQQIGVCKIGRS